MLTLELLFLLLIKEESTADKELDDFPDGNRYAPHRTHTRTSVSLIFIRPFFDEYRGARVA